MSKMSGEPSPRPRVEVVRNGMELAAVAGLRSAAADAVSGQTCPITGCEPSDLERGTHPSPAEFDADAPELRTGGEPAP